LIEKLRDDSVDGVVES